MSITGSESRINFNTLDLCESDFSYSLLCEARPVDRTNLLFYKKEGSFSRDQFLSVADNGSLILTGVGTRLGHEGIYICEGNMSGRISQSSIKLNGKLLYSCYANNCLCLFVCLFVCLFGILSLVEHQGPSKFVRLIRNSY